MRTAIGLFDLFHSFSVHFRVFLIYFNCFICFCYGEKNVPKKDLRGFCAVSKMPRFNGFLFHRKRLYFIILKCQPNVDFQIRSVLTVTLNECMSMRGPASCIYRTENSLFRVINIIVWYVFSVFEQQRFWFICVDALACQSLCWSHMLYESPITSCLLSVTHNFSPPLGYVA